MIKDMQQNRKYDEKPSQESASSSESFAPVIMPSNKGPRRSKTFKPEETFGREVSSALVNFQFLEFKIK